jgi:hypothetical protein
MGREHFCVSLQTISQGIIITGLVASLSQIRLAFIYPSCMRPYSLSVALCPQVRAIFCFHMCRETPFRLGEKVTRYVLENSRSSVHLLQISRAGAGDSVLAAQILTGEGAQRGHPRTVCAVA